MCSQLIRGAIYRVCFVLFIEERRVAKTATRHCSNSLLKNKLTEESPTYVTSGGVCPHASPFPRYRGRSAPESHVHKLSVYAKSPTVSLSLAYC